MVLDVMHRYFDGERSAGVLLAALGVMALGFSWWLRAGGGALRAMMFPVALVGALQLAVGVGLAAKTGAQVAALEQGFSTGDGSAARAAERARMERVQRNFVIIKRVWTALALVALGLAMLGGRDARVAVGIGLAVQMSVMLAFDVFAEARGAAYLAWLRAG